MDVYLVVSDPNANQYDINDSTNGTETFRRFNAVAGLYDIYANTIEPDVGNYTLCVENNPLPSPTPTPCSNQETPFGPEPPDGVSGVPVTLTVSWNTTTGGGSKVIYGTDDRRDVYEVSHSDLLRIADSTVMLVDPSKLKKNDDGTYTLNVETLNDYFEGELCPDEPYRQQPRVGFCTGFLVAPDIVVTAGHCVTSNEGCRTGAVIVFGFDMIDSATARLTLPAEDVYPCYELIDRRLDSRTGEDWSVFRLDREVVGHRPLPIRRSGKIADDQKLVLIGHPIGLPKKIDGGGHVRNNANGSYFIANLDSYGGNSGSPVFNADTFEVEGVLVRGEEDFVTVEGCLRSQVCPDDGCRGEDCVRTTVFEHLIPSPVQYEIYFGSCNDLRSIGTTGETSFALPPLSEGTRYCWKVVASNTCGSVESAVWSFTTAGNGVPAPTPTLTPGGGIPSVTPTPLPTVIDPDADLDPDGAIDGRDLLVLVRRLREESTNPSQMATDLFIFARNWRRTLSR